MIRRILGWLAALVAALSVLVVAAALATWPADIDYVPALPAIDGDAAEWLAKREAAITAEIIQGTEKRIRWHDPESRAVTPLVVVYLHGFSASRKEIAPVPERLADELGANLFETRLKGHGLAQDGLDGVSAEDWLRDTDEALAVGRALGERTILIGTSTGATLALVRLAAGDAPEVAGLILLSPNFGPADPSADLLLEPGGPLLGRLLVGRERSFTPANAAQARYWTTRYPLAAVVEMMRLVADVRDRLPLSLDVPVLAMMSREDRVIDVSRALEGLTLIQAPAMRILSVASTDPGRHVPAGDILSPGQTAITVTRMRAFIADHVRGEPDAGSL